MRLYLDCFRPEIALPLAQGLRPLGWGVQTLPPQLPADALDLGTEPSGILLDAHRPWAVVARVLQRLRGEGPFHTVLCLIHPQSDGAALLEAGADDLILPPYAPREVDLRLRARLAPAPWLHLPPCRLDLRRAEAQWPQACHPLTAIEVKLLHHLAAHPHRAVPREELLAAVWGYSPEVDTRAVALAVSRLRRKIEIDPQEPRYLHTVYGIGYRLSPGEAFAPGPASLPGGRLPPMLGRGACLATLEDGLSRGHPLFILHGPGGVGKTRLALALGQAARGARPVLSVDLSGGIDPAVAVAALGDGVGLPGAPAAELETALGRALAGSGALLILDGCEGVLGPLASVLRALATVAGVQVVVTTRIRIPQPLPHARWIPLSGLAPEDAARLFVARAQAALPGFEATPALDADIRRIVHTLDGLPLAIELAASRIRILSVPQIAAGLAHPLALLKRPGPTSDPRHDALEQTLQGSWALLSPPLREALSILALSCAPFTVDTAAALLPSEPGPLDALSILVDHSLLQVEGDGRERRFRLADPVRAFAQARLTEGQARLRHLGHFTRVAAELAQDLHGAEVLPARRRLRAVQGDLLAAFAYACAEAPGRAPALLLSLCQIYWRLGEGGALDLIDGCPLLPDSPEMIAIERLKASFLGRGGDPIGAWRLAEHHMARAEVSGDRERLGEAWALLATLALSDGRIDETLAAGQRALALLPGPRHREVQAVVIKTLGVAHRLSGRLGRARALLAQALDLCLQGSATWQAAMLRGSVAIVHHRLGESAAAIAHTLESLAFYRALGDRRTELTALTNLCIFELEGGDVDAGERYLGAAWGVGERYGGVGEIHLLTTLRGQLALERGALGDARSHFAEARLLTGGVTRRLRSFTENQDAWGRALEGDWDGALERLGEAQAMAAALHNAHQVGRHELLRALVLGLRGDGARGAEALGRARAALVGSEPPDTASLLALVAGVLSPGGVGAVGAEEAALIPAFPELRWARRLLAHRASGA